MMTRIYEPQIVDIHQTMELSDTNGQHVGVVLRKKENDGLTLFCGDNREFHAVIESIHRKKVVVRILSETFVNRESPLHLHLVQAVLRKEKMDFVIQKATELGVKHIWPVFTEHVNVAMDASKIEKKHRQWEAIAISASEQCGRNVLPEIHFPMTLPECLKHHTESDKWLLSPKGQISFRNMKINEAPICLFVGPEGGFSESEISLLLAENTKGVVLGPRVLRTETAGLAALSVLQALFGDLCS